MSMRPTTLATCPPAREERAFGVVEVIIAVLLIMVVASGVVLAMSSSSNLRGAARLQVAMTHTGQRMIEDLAGDTTWMSTCAAPRCAIAGRFADPDSRRIEDVDGVVEVLGPDTGVPPETESHAVPVDSEVDGVGDADQDGVRPDHYQVTLVIRPHADVIARYPGDAAALTRRFSTSMDRNGNILKGSLRVDACVVRNQVDERMSIDGCDASGTTNVTMDGCPDSPPDSLAHFYGGCAQAYGWVRDVPSSVGHALPSPFVMMQRVNPASYSFTITNTSTDESIESSAAKVVNGSYVFENVDSGSYRITGLPNTMNVGGIVHERWVTKELPSWHNDPKNQDGSVGVQPGVKNHALVMYRPPSTGHGLRFRFDRETAVREEQLRPPVSEKTWGPLDWEGERWIPTDYYEGNGSTEYCEEDTDDEAINYVPIDGGWYEYASQDGGYKYMSRRFIWDDPQYDYIKFMSNSCSINDHPTLENCEYINSYATFSTYARLEDGSQGEMTDIDTYDHSYRFCTFYRNVLHHTYWSSSDPETVIRDGAVKTAVYEVSPRPTLREIDFGPGMSHASSTPKRNFCIVRGHTTGRLDLDQAECDPDRSNIDDLLPGLNTSVRTPGTPPVSITNPDTGNIEDSLANAAANQNVIGMPGWAAGAGLWVRPEGGIIGGDGSSRGIDPQIHLRGRGECYWTGQPHLGNNEYEGSCNPCQPVWKPGLQIDDACGVLERTCVDRYVLEVKTHFSDAGMGGGENITSTNGIVGPRQVPAVGGGCATYPDPPWACESLPPSILDDNCKPWTPDPPPQLTSQTYETSAGRARVDQQPVTTGRQGY